MTKSEQKEAFAGDLRDTLSQALQMEIIDDLAWMESIKTRDLISHYYDEEVSEVISYAIVNKYYPLLVNFEKQMNSLSRDI